MNVEKKLLREVMKVCENLRKAADSLMGEVVHTSATNWGLVNSSMCSATDLIKEIKEMLHEGDLK